MRYILLLSILFTCFSLYAKPYHKNINEPFRKVHLSNKQKVTDNIQYRKDPATTNYSVRLLKRDYRNLQTNETVFKPVQVVKNGHDTVNYPTEFVLYTYDDFGNPLTEVTQQIQNGSRTNVRRISYTNDNMGNNLTALYEKWMDTSWVYMYQYTSEYDNAGSIVSELEQKWQDGNWENMSRYTYSYDNSGNWLTELYEFWDSTSSAWTPDSRYTATRDENGKLLTDVSEIWDNGEWVNDFQTSYTYDNNGNSISELDQVWEDGTWFDFLRYSATYNNDGFWLTAFYEQFEDSTATWIPTYRYSATYDIVNNLLEDLREIWTNGSWENLNKNSYDYDVNGNAVHGESYVWANGDWSLDWGNLNLTYNNHNESIFCNALVADAEYASFFVTAVEDKITLPALYSLSQNYPNPFNPVTNINYELPKDSHIKLRIFDLLGNEIASLVNEVKHAGKYSIQFNGSSLSSGVYFYKLETEGFTSTKKLVLLK